MIYGYLKIVVGIVLRVFYRIQIKGLENLPADRPVIISCNHPNAFMDAIILCTHVKQKLYSLVRSDVFKGGIGEFFFRAVGMRPIYRIQEGVENLQKNEETFRNTAKMLQEKKTIIIFSEGICVQERRLRKLKKGLARIVFGSEEAADYKLDLCVVPIALNYEKPWKFRSRLFINIGKPIGVKEFIPSYISDKARTINHFLKHTEEKMAELLEIIRHKEDDDFVEQIETLVKSEWVKEKGKDPDHLEARHEVAKEIMHMVENLHHHEEQYHRLKNKCSGYFSRIEQKNLRDHLLKPESITSMTGWGVLSDFAFFFFGFPLFLFGLIANYVPFVIPGMIAKKVVKNIEFHASILAGAATFTFQIWYILLTVIAGFILPQLWMLAIFVPMLYFSGKFVISYSNRMKKSSGKSRLIKLLIKDRTLIEDLVRTRMELTKELSIIYRRGTKVMVVEN